MPVDRGGLRYRITVEDNFSSGLASFRSRTKGAREEWNKLKRDLQSGFQSKGIKDASTAASQAAQSERRLSDARRKGRRQLSIKQLAERRYAREVVNSAEARERARIAEQRQFTVDRKVATVQQLRRKAERDISNLLNKRLIIQQRLAAVTRRGLKLTEKEAIALGLASRITIRLTAEQRKLVQIKERLAAAQKLTSNTELLRLEAERRAVERINRERLKQLEIQSLARRGLGPNAQPLIAPEQPQQRRGILGFFSKLRKRVDKTNQSGNRISFTFRRLFGILAAFAAARIIVRLFRDMVTNTIRLNAELETSKLGIAALIGSIADVRDSTGETTDAATRLAIATGEAAKQVRQLRLDALTTTATFQELVFTFQTALAPGLRAGLDIDQIRIFAREMSIAAAAIGLEQRHLSEEVRSLLSGRIRPGQTRIASLLGITPADIKQAKEAGNLFEFLTEQFEVFDAAGTRAAQTFTGLTQRVKDGLQIIAQTGGLDFFNDLKGLLEEIFESLIAVDEATQQLRPNQGLVQLVATIADGLGSAVVEAKRLRDALSFEDVGIIAEGARELIEFVVGVLGAVIEGMLLGLRDVSAALLFIRGVIQTLTGLDILDPATVRVVVRFLVRALTIIVTIGLLLGTFTIIIKGFGIVLTSILGVLKVMVVVVSTLKAGLIGVRAVLLTLGIAAAPFLATVLAAAAAVGSILFAFREIKKVLIDGEDTFVSTLGAIAIVKAQLAEAERRLTAKTFPAGNLVLQGKSRERGEARVKALRAQLLLLGLDMEKQSLNIEEKTEEFILKFVEAWAGGFESVLNLQKAFGDKVIAELEGIISRSSEALQELRQEFQRLNEEVRRSRGQAGVTKSILGLEQGIADVIRERGEANLQFLERSRKLTSEVFELEESRKQIDKQRAGGKLTLEQDKTALAAVTALDDQISELQRERKRFELVLQLAASGRVLGGLRDINFEQQQEQALLRIEAIRTRDVTQAVLARDFRKAALLETRASLDVLKEEQRIRTETAQKSLDAIKEEIALSRERIRLIEKTESGSETDDTQNRVGVETQIIEKLERRAFLLQEELALANLITEAERNRLLVQEQIEAAAETDPIKVGFLQAFIEANQQVADTFQTTLDIMKGAITSFSQFVAKSIVDAFDPTSNQTIQQRFAQFLKQLALQVITTLITLAITAIALNAASGGLLGPLLAGLSQAQGLAEGGEVGEETRKHGRRNRRAVARHRARGFAEGGTPSAREVHGIRRPSGLDSRDTVAAYLDPKEWVVRATSVAKAGSDALDRINRGLFDPYALRAAVGLHGWRRSSVIAGMKGGPGLVEGGPASSVSQGVTSAPVGGGGSASVAVISPSEEATERLLRGGEQSLLRLLADNGIVPNA